ncbi:Heat shock protein 60 family co-chaperone GroES, partial [uncultured Rubrobacteraceae bacterium]
EVQAFGRAGARPDRRARAADGFGDSPARHGQGEAADGRGRRRGPVRGRGQGQRGRRHRLRQVLGHRDQPRRGGLHDPRRRRHPGDSREL